ncbi:hypothetical protein ZOSMA_13G00580 [Zostera marina]|uniref:Uncharacterized protein n=1 Tax=Zostera marina TaxID=29655 RepID=A0A0K9PXS3_ZOSMR|nr:hypothetical protein ZOSMA_13G00580 [Zostera marina]
MHIPDFPSSEASTSRAPVQQTPQPTIEPEEQTLTQPRGRSIIFSRNEISNSKLVIKKISSKKKKNDNQQNRN